LLIRTIKILLLRQAVLEVPQSARQPASPEVKLWVCDGDWFLFLVFVFAQIRKCRSAERDDPLLEPELYFGFHHPLPYIPPQLCGFRAVCGNSGTA
jgi:hypothetical protein